MWALEVTKPFRDDPDFITSQVFKPPIFIKDFILILHNGYFYDLFSFPILKKKRNQLHPPHNLFYPRSTCESHLDANLVPACSDHSSRLPPPLCIKQVWLFQFVSWFHCLIFSVFINCLSGSGGKIIYVYLLLVSLFFPIWIFASLILWIKWGLFQTLLLFIETINKFPPPSMSHQNPKIHQKRFFCKAISRTEKILRRPSYPRLNPAIWPSGKSSNFIPSDQKNQLCFGHLIPMAANLEIYFLFAFHNIGPHLKNAIHFRFSI